MTDAPRDNSADLPLLDLYRAELEKHGAALLDGLEQPPDGAPDALLKKLLRAARAIKGASAIVSLPASAALAGELEAFLAKAQRGECAFSADGIQTLRKAARFFTALAASRAADIPAALEARNAEARGLADAIKTLSGAPAPSPAPSPAPAPARTEPEPGGDAFMLDLFRTEAENNARALENGLVNAESDSSPARMEPLMRAAHSLKGAARIVGLKDCVTLAHAMEDVFIAAQTGRLKLAAADVDALLRANDVFLKLGAAAAAAIPGLVREAAATLAGLAANLRAILEGRPEEPGPQAAPEEPAPALPARPAPAAAPDEQTESQVVRVLAESLTRLVGLAGETLVQTRTLEPLGALQARIRQSVQALNSVLEQALVSLAGRDAEPGLRARLDDAFRQSGHILNMSDLCIERLTTFSRRMEHLADHLYSEVIESRMRPFADGLHGFPRLVRDLARKLDKKVRLEIRGAGTRIDRDILEKLDAPLTHLIQNSLDHGIETPADRKAAGKPEEGRVVLDARHGAGMLIVSVSDDGRGIAVEPLREKIAARGYVTAEMAANLTRSELFDFLFLPGFSTAGQVTEISGRGVGLDVVQSMIREVGGSLRVESRENAGATFLLQLPLTLSVVRALLVEISGEPYAIPLSKVEHVLVLAPGGLQTIDDRQYCPFNGENLGVVPAHQVLRVAPAAQSSGSVFVAVLNDRAHRYGMVVDRFLGQRELVVLPLDRRLGKIPNIAAGAVLESGAPALILDADDLARSIDKLLAQSAPAKVGGAGPAAGPKKLKRVLVVDDSLTVREVERKLLENRGYEVKIAVDGMDGWNMLLGGPFDLVITDVDMPRMDGIALARRLKADARFKDLPVMIVSYKDRPEDRLRGLEAGANYYLTKSSFHDESLLGAVRDLIGES